MMNSTLYFMYCFATKYIHPAAAYCNSFPFSLSIHSDSARRSYSSSTRSRIEMRSAMRCELEIDILIFAQFLNIRDKSFQSLREGNDTLDGLADQISM